MAGDMRVCYVPGKGGKQPFYAGRREGGKVVALYWPLLSPSFSHIQEDKKLERKLKNGMRRFVGGVCLGFLPFVAAILASRGSLLSHKRRNRG